MDNLSLVDWIEDKVRMWLSRLLVHLLMTIIKLRWGGSGILLLNLTSALSLIYTLLWDLDSHALNLVWKNRLHDSAVEGRKV
jgi:hypothetical protein